jgi:hypothetical protein
MSNEHDREHARDTVSTSTLTRVCAATDCDHPFTPQSPRAKFCSQACRQADYRARHQLRPPRQRDEWVNSRRNTRQQKHSGR